MNKIIRKASRAPRIGYEACPSMWRTFESPECLYVEMSEFALIWNFGHAIRKVLR